MNAERSRYIRDLQALAPLSDHTDAIGVDANGKVVVQKKLPPPIDEFGIPRPEIMVRDLLGQMTTENYIWTGKIDLHHLATPKADFSVVRTKGEGAIGSDFRGMACLKIEPPRQMHNFAHHLFELPGRPSVDTMRQAVYEIDQAKLLSSTIDTYMNDSSINDTSKTQALCQVALAAIFEKMQEPQIGILPCIEELHNMELTDLRRTVNSLLRVRRLSKKHLIHPAIRKSSEWTQSRQAA